jgi:hypothetical protein
VTNSLAVLDHTGDTRIEWDPEKPDEVAAARKMFDELKEKRYLAYRAGENAEPTMIRKFDPSAAKIVMTPQLVGG